MILDGSYILQLRDNKPTIGAPGQWSLFGGKIKTGEAPLQTIKREVYEELSVEPLDYNYLWYTVYYYPFEKSVVRSWFFVSDATTVWSGYKLREGKAVGIFEFKQIAKLDMPKVMYQTLERFHRQRENSFTNVHI